jgi:chromosome segregation ATPase
LSTLQELSTQFQAMQIRSFRAVNSWRSAIESGASRFTDTLEQENSVLAFRIESLTRELDEMRQQFSNQVGISTELDSKVERLDQIVQKKRTKIKALKNSDVKLAEQIATYEALTESLMQEKSTYAALTEQLEHQKLWYEEQMSKDQQIRKILETQTSKTSALQTEMEEAKQRFEQSTRELQTQKEKYASVMANLARLEEVYSELTRGLEEERETTSRQRKGESEQLSMLLNELRVAIEQGNLSEE